MRNGGIKANVSEVCIYINEIEKAYGIESYLYLEGYDVFTTNDPHKVLKIIEKK